MKIIMYFSSGDKVIGDLLTPPQRKERETQSELESRITRALNESQPHCANKITKCLILRN